MMFDHEGSRSEFLKLLAEFGEEPAFIARANSVHYALESLLQGCTAKREEMLEWPYRRLEHLARLIGSNWNRIAPLLVRRESVAELEALHSQMSFNSYVHSSWFATEKSALREYVESAERFNRGWHTYLASIDYESVNKPRQDYNQYYRLEKACAFGSERLSEEFEPLAMIDIRFLESRFPYLPVPELA
jgi:hypothetical protein